MDEFTTDRLFKLDDIDHFEDPRFIKPRNFVFARSKSSKFTENKKNSVLKQRGNFQDSLFIPKIKSKQISCHPKFFFSVQRKKIKAQKSEPSFPCYQNKLQNPQNKKRKHNLKYFSNKNQIILNEAIHVKETPRKSFSRIKTTEIASTELKCQKQLASYLSEQIKQAPIPKQHGSSYKSVFLRQNEQCSTTFKRSKRPKFNQNITFLIRRRKQKKQSINLSKISHLKLQNTSSSYLYKND